MEYEMLYVGTKQTVNKRRKSHRVVLIAAAFLAAACSNQTETVAYGTEAGFFQNIGIPTIVCGPGDIAQAHIANEFIEIKQIELCEAFLRRVIESLQ